MDQREAIKQIIEKFGENRPLIVSDIGSQSCWLKDVADDDGNFYLSGPMGLASSVALGLAISMPNENVLAICGDGSLAMNLSSLVSIAHSAPSNLYLCVIVNDIYEYTQSLPSPSLAINWLDLGVALFDPESCFTLESFVQMQLPNTQSPHFIVANVDVSNKAAPSLGLTPTQIVGRFREVLKKRNRTSC